MQHICLFIQTNSQKGTSVAYLEDPHGGRLGLLRPAASSVGTSGKGQDHTSRVPTASKAGSLSSGRGSMIRVKRTPSIPSEPSAFELPLYIYKGTRGILGLWF